jgi:hypothetical protein
VNHSEEQWSTVKHSEAQWSTVKHSEAQWSTVKHSEAHWRTVKHSEAQWSTVKHSEALHSAVNHIEAHCTIGQWRKHQSTVQKTVCATLCLLICITPFYVSLKFRGSTSIKSLRMRFWQWSGNFRGVLSNKGRLPLRGCQSHTHDRRSSSWIRNCRAV